MRSVLSIRYLITNYIYIQYIYTERNIKKVNTKYFLPFSEYTGANSVKSLLANDALIVTDNTLWKGLVLELVWL